jgi:hypothetical protein
VRCSAVGEGMRRKRGSLAFFHGADGPRQQGSQVPKLPLLPRPVRYWARDPLSVTPTTGLAGSFPRHETAFSKM